MTHLYLEAFSGISGDMFIGALLDLGLDLDEFRANLSLLNVEGYELSAGRVARSGIQGTKFDTILNVEGKDASLVPHAHGDPDHVHAHHRHLSDIVAIIEESRLSDDVKRRSIAVFRDLAQAEATVHGIPLEAVHFHEVGALDSIVDIVGAFVALEMLGVEKVFCSEVCDGSGFIEVAHGVIPVPVPAVMQMRVGTDIPFRQLSDIRTELVTPTGMGILKEIVDGFGPLPRGWEIERVGYGFGSREIAQLNALRVLKCRKSSSHRAVKQNEDSVVLIETNIDDQSPETLAPVMDILLAEGALDVFFAPIQMKKNRPAMKLSVLINPADLDKMVRSILRLTSTVGIRYQCLNRVIMERSFDSIQTRFGPISVKISTFDGIKKTTPEFEDCLTASRKHGVSLQEIYQDVYKHLD